MEYISINFIVFIVFLVIVYRVTSTSYKSFLLIIASYIFYSFDRIEYLVILITITLLTYFLGKLIEVKRNQLILTSSIFTLLLPLLLYKYFDLFLDIFTVVFRTNKNLLEADFSSILPIGISFYTLQAISYIVDVYQKRTAVCHNPITLGLYVSFFPQLIAGPIERAQNIIPQLNNLERLRVQNLYIGFKIILAGFFAKIVLADTLFVFVNSAFTNYQDYDSYSLIVSVFIYSIRIYFDFYGYSLIAIGLGRAFGIRLSTNFNNPYFSTSIKDFWRNWHITFMTWIRDYIYIPLGGNRNTGVRYLVIILIIFVFSGLWHGANYNYMIWGLYHAVLFYSGSLIQKHFNFNHNFTNSVLKSVVRVIRTLTIFILVSIGWLFFVYENYLDSINFLMNIINSKTESISLFQTNLNLGFYFLSLVAVCFMVLDYKGIIREITNSYSSKLYNIVRDLIFIDITFITSVLFSDIGKSSFIYFRF